MTDLPLPPADLAERVGPGDGPDPLTAYLNEGAAVRSRIEALLPADWTFDGKRVLDFGCGSARVLRHFVDQADRAELWGCDIDGRSIEWIESNLSPPFRCFQNDIAPPLPLDDGYLDLVWATSVFTHIDIWSEWLVEMHRVLKPGGILISSFLGEGMWESLVGEPYNDDEVGMTVLGHWREGGAGSWVFHSEWWLREHWGRAFDVIEVAQPDRAPDGSAAVTHSYIAAARRPGDITRAELDRADPSEPRELAAQQTNVRLLRRELAQLAEGLNQPPPMPGLRAAAAAAVDRRIRRRA